MERPVVVGRRTIDNTGGFALHYGVKVDGTWYEIEGAGKGAKGGPNRVLENEGSLWENEKYGDILGTTTVGTTCKTDDNIKRFLQTWLARNPSYGLTDDNCQKFSHEFVAYLTDGNFRWPFKFDAAFVGSSFDHSDPLRIDHDGTILRRYGTFHERGVTGPTHFGLTGPSAQFSAVDRGYEGGAWADLNVMQAEFGLNRYMGGHVGLNANTGIGIRDGNFDLHVLGFGFKVGVDGVEFNTPVAGVNACVIF